MSHDRELPKEHEFRGAKRRVEVALANHAVNLEERESVGGADVEGAARGKKVMRDLRTVLAAAEHAYAPCESSACEDCRKASSSSERDMEGFLGEKVVKNLKGTPFEHFTPTHWALHFVESYGQIDGDHHKLWVLDQVARVLNGTPVVVSWASWKGGHGEWRFSTGKPSKGHLEWVEKMRHPEGEGGEEYGYDEGIAP